MLEPGTGYIPGLGHHFITEDSSIINYWAVVDLCQKHNRFVLWGWTRMFPFVHVRICEFNKTNKPNETRIYTVTAWKKAKLCKALCVCVCVCLLRTTGFYLLYYSHIFPWGNYADLSLWLYVVTSLQVTEQTKNRNWYIKECQMNFPLKALNVICCNAGEWLSLQCAVLDTIPHALWLSSSASFCNILFF